MKKIWLTIAGVVAVVGMLLMAGCGTAGNPGDVTVNLNSQSQGLWVNGEGKVTATPDLAIISVGVEAQELTVAEAQSKAAEAMDKVIQALKDQDVDEKDIQTSYFNISKVTRWVNDKMEEEVIGYRVSNTVTVKVRNIEKAGETIDAAAAAGGDLIRINGITFTVEDPKNYNDDARAEAIENAKAKAEQMASKAGITLGKVTYLTENNYFQPIYRAYDAMESAAAPGMSPKTSIEAGELEITVTVQMAFEIK